MEMFEVSFSWYLKISISPYCKQGCVNKYMLAILAPNYLFSAALFTLSWLFSLEIFQWCTISLLPLWKYSGYFCNIRKHQKNLICLSVDTKKYISKKEHFFFLSQTVAFCWTGMTANHHKWSLENHLKIEFMVTCFAVTGTTLHLQCKLSSYFLCKA